MHVASPTVHFASDPVIPAMRGKFYSYSALFTPDRPFGFLMDCKANKSRPIMDIASYSHEHDLTFLFAGSVSVCSPNAAPSIRLLDNLIATDKINQTSIIARPDITKDAFEALRQKKDVDALAATCRYIMPRNSAAVALSTETIFAVITKSGKYGLFMVKELTPTSLRIDAAHVLL